ncbi:MAG: hypothetical protein DRQ48_07480 [Gammaproteobacteria bacterium]|nr:MAG: hypothetical protein DRQ58_01535 [Gammaproteobacteria bacterium]RKZ69722.1 MAG: hypothetical protein DRQ48_07480 [Gammaproteobacteria bacterium]
MTEKNFIEKAGRMIRNILGQSSKSSARKIYSNAESADLSLDMSQREKAIYGEDKIRLQKLYEKWAVKESWHLKSQGIPLLLSIDPEIYSNSSVDEATEKKYQDLWEHAQHCVEQDLLLVLNRESPVDEWEATPIDVYKWAAISRVDLPEQLSTLMEFVMMAVLSTVNNPGDSSAGKSQNEASYNSDKEHILGAALAMLATYPEQCMNKKGRLRAENIVSLINENEGSLFAGQTPDLSATAAVDLINKWLEPGP